MVQSKHSHFSVTTYSINANLIITGKCPSSTYLWIHSTKLY